MTRLVAWSLVLALGACSSSKREAGGEAGASSETGGATASGGAGGGAATGGSKAGASGAAGAATGGAAGDATAGTGGAGAMAGAGPSLARMFTERSSGVTGDLDFLATNGDVIVAAGTNQLVYSEDGVTWEIPEPPVEAVAVAYGGGTFVAVNEMDVVFTSPDGKVWASAMPFPTMRWELRTITYAFGKFFTTGYGATREIYLTSPDGITWTTNTATFPPLANLVLSAWSSMSLTTSAGEWVFMSSTAGQPGHNFGSKDGLVWDVVDDWTSLIYDVAFDGTTYCSVGAYSGGASTDGVEWTATAVGFHGVTVFDGMFWAVGAFGDVGVSRDCLTWQRGAEPRLPEYLPNDLPASMRAIREHKGRLVAVGAGGRVYTAP